MQPPNGSYLLTSRWLIFIAMFIGVFLVVVSRLFYLQVFDHERMMQLAAGQQQDVVEVSARRGTIYDRRMNELAGSVVMPSVWANPKEIKNLSSLVEKISGILDLDPSWVRKKLTSSQNYRLLKRRVPPDVELGIKEAALPGIHLIPEPKRFYPHKEMAGQILGFLDGEDQAGYGLERYYDKLLRGMPGKAIIEKDARQQILESQYSQKSIPGSSLILTIDKNIQFIVEQELSAAVVENNAQAGTVVLMNPENGEILAMANYPDFNPNRYSEYPVGHFRNRAVTDVYEPGSTFKVVTIGSALDEGILSPHEMIDCQNGRIVLANHIVKDVHAYGLLDYAGIISHSSNIGAIKIGLRMGKERFYRRILAFGLGRKTGIDIPAEVPGLLRKSDAWSAVSAGFIGMGYEIGVTPLQMVTVVSVVANGGHWVKPYLVKKVIGPDGELIHENLPERRQILQDRTVSQLRMAMEAVVAEGTARAARMEQYGAAGKTGTAKKQNGSGYLQGKYIASFIGYAPAKRPVFSAIVVIDEPTTHSYMGGAVAAPVFKRIAEKVLRYLEVAPEKRPVIKDLMARNQGVRSSIAAEKEEMPPDINSLFAEGDAAAILPDVLVVGEDDRLVRMPDFRGKTMRAILEECNSMGIELSFHGMGVAVEQEPLPGTPLIPNSKCFVRLARNSKPAAETAGSNQTAAKYRMVQGVSPSEDAPRKIAEAVH